jgi:hypothetical protein
MVDLERPNRADPFDPKPLGREQIARRVKLLKLRIKRMELVAALAAIAARAARS